MKFVIYAPLYDENSGGAIVLYKLYETLVKLGFLAYIAPFRDGLGVPMNIIGRLRSHQQKWKIKHEYIKKTPHLVRINSADSIGDDYVVVYPEVVDGNPLRARNVVRWLLHRPGFHTGRVSFGESDLVFFYDKQFDDPMYNKLPSNHLRVIENHSAIYFKKNHFKRSGSCYMVRKGAGRSLDCHPVGAELLDGRSHQYIAEAFNRYEYFYSYDLYSMYSRFAAICGCKSVVVPIQGVSIEEWYPDKTNWNGVAYGVEDLPRAMQTVDILIDSLGAIERENARSVENFVKTCISYFN